MIGEPQSDLDIHRLMYFFEKLWHKFAGVCSKGSDKFRRKELQQVEYIDEDSIIS